jgi:uncharacterized protein (TIGR01244 family)
MITTLSAIGVLIALIAGPFSQQSTAPIARKQIPGIENYSRVDATVGCGGATETSAFPALKKEGFVSVVNLRMTGEPGVDVPAATQAAVTGGLKYFHVPFNASSPDPAVVGRFLEIVVNPENQPVYIHCGSANRVGAVWLIKRVVVDGWDTDRAVSEAEAIGLRSPGLKAFALDYIRERKQP